MHVPLLYTLYACSSCEEEGCLLYWTVGGLLKQVKLHYPISFLILVSAYSVLYRKQSIKIDFVS